MKTSELTGAALDWAVAMCAGVRIGQPEHISYALEFRMMHDSGDLAYSTDWAQGGPIIERERLYVQPEISKEGAGNAWYAVSMHNTDAFGPTPLIAAMRCYVASKLGDNIDIPQELL